MRRRLLFVIAVVLLSAAGCQRKKVAVISVLPEPVGRPAVDAVDQTPERPSKVVPSEPAAVSKPGWVAPGGISSRWTCVVIHHSATEGTSPQDIDRAHRRRGWDEMGYHFVIGNGIAYPEGKVFVGPRWRKQKHGAHCKTPGNYYNEHGIGICLIGNFEDRKPSETQMRALATLVKFLMSQRDIGSDRIYTHKGITDKTLCPGKYFSLSNLVRRLGGPSYATSR